MRSLAPGLIPIYEEHTTRIERGIGLKDWGNMPGDEKAMLVALRRTAMAMKNLQAEAELKENKKVK